ncbi:MAG: amidase [Acidiferrobacterales bacterium]|nr:amidase [Acidiferrobacterales bacterium]
MTIDPAKHSLQEISDVLTNRNLSSVELTEYSISRKELDSYSNAYKYWCPESGLMTAKEADDAYDSGKMPSPLQGIPVSLKDIYGHPKFPIFAGSYRELPHKWRKPGPIVHSLMSQLSVFCGKTHTVEFAYGGLGVNSHWETPRNPWCKDAHRVPGGSSSGAGISIHQGSALVALGTDTAGSVRIPASCAGVVGLKTSHRLWSTRGIVPLSPLLDTAGVLTRTARDCAYAFHAISHPDESLSQHRARLDRTNHMQSENFRIGVADSGIMWDCQDDISEICMAAVHALEGDGCSIVPIEFPNAETAIEIRDKGGTTSVELIEFLGSELPQWLDNLDPVISERIKIGGDISAIEYLTRIRQIRQARIEVQNRFENYDVIAAPTVPITPPLLDEARSDEDYMPLNLLTLRNTGVGSYLDLCAISIPVGLDRSNMPVGIQLMAPAGKEHLLLAIGQRLESIIPRPALI